MLDVSRRDARTGSCTEFLSLLHQKMRLREPDPEDDDACRSGLNGKKLCVKSGRSEAENVKMRNEEALLEKRIFYSTREEFKKKGAFIRKLEK